MYLIDVPPEVHFLGNHVDEMSIDLSNLLKDQEMAILGVDLWGEEVGPILTEQFAIAALGEGLEDVVNVLLLAPLHRLDEHFRGGLDLPGPGDQPAAEIIVIVPRLDPLSNQLQMRRLLQWA